MDCPSFEELLRDAAHPHLSACEPCRALVEAWAEADATLEAALGDVQAPPTLLAAVKARTRDTARVQPPSAWPEVLDFVGWAAVLVLTAFLIPRLIPVFNQAFGKM